MRILFKEIKRLEHSTHNVLIYLPTEFHKYGIFRSKDIFRDQYFISVLLKSVNYLYL